MSKTIKIICIAVVSVMAGTLCAQPDGIPGRTGGNVYLGDFGACSYIPDSLLHIRYPLRQVYRAGLGFIPVSEIPEGWEFDSEGFMGRYATLPISETVEDLNYYYDDYVMHLGAEGKRREMELMKKVARQHKSRRLEDEVRFLDAFVCYFEINDENLVRSWKVAQEFEREGKLLLSVRLKSHLFARRQDGLTQNYYIAFGIADELLKDIGKLTEEEYPQKRNVYSEIGHLHYIFRDYDIAVPLLEKAMSDRKNDYYFQTANLRARNTLAVYYRSQGDLERSVCYYRSMLASPDDNLALRAMFDAIALANLGQIVAEQGNYADALRLYRTAIPAAVAVNDYNFATGILINQGKCYVEQGRTEEAARIIDTVRQYLGDPEKYVNRHRRRGLYSLLNKYYLRQGDIVHSEMYADSMVVAEKDYEEEFNTRILLRTRQELFEAEKAARDDKISSQKKQLVSVTVIIILALGALLAIILLYRKKNAAYRALVRKSMEWASNTETPEPFTPDAEIENNIPAAEDRQLLQATHERIRQNSLHKDPAITLNSLAEIMGVNHAALSRAINATGRNFNQFINEYRVKEAIQLLSELGRLKSMDEIAEMSGFNSRTSFYRAFKLNTGLTPAEFRNMQ